MQSEISTWLSSIPCGLDLKYLAKDFEDRGFTTKESLKYIDSSDLDVLFPSPLKLSHAKKKILLKEIEQLSSKDISQEPFGGTKTQSAAHVAHSAESSSTSFLAKKEERFSDDIQFLEARIPSAKQEYTRLQQQVGDYDRMAPKRAKTCSNCHLTGHQKRHCKNQTCPGISQCSLQCKHPEIKAEIAELQGLIKDLEKRSEKSKNEFLNFKAAKEKASNSFFAIMRPRLRKSNPMKYAGTDRLILDRDLMTLKKALNNKIPVGEENDWQLPLIIEEFARRNIQPLQLAPAVAPGSETLTHDVSKPTSSRRLDFLL